MRFTRNVIAAGVAASLLGFAFGASAADVTPFNVTLPTVTGPIPSTPTNFAMGVEGFDIMPAVPKGYVIEEFFFSGKGNIYENLIYSFEVELRGTNSAITFKDIYMEQQELPWIGHLRAGHFKERKPNPTA